jgi:hypothetical protein
MYTISWTGAKSRIEHQECGKGCNNIYEYASELEDMGAKDIVIYLDGEEVDTYLQGRSTRNFPLLYIVK